MASYADKSNTHKFDMDSFSQQQKLSSGLLIMPASFSAIITVAIFYSLFNALTGFAIAARNV
jgi:hypothetical protein